MLLLGFLLALCGRVALFVLHDPGARRWGIVSGATLNLLLLPTPIIGAYMFLNVPAWSLMFEILANFAYAKWTRYLTRGSSSSSFSCRARFWSRSLTAACSGRAARSTRSRSVSCGSSSRSRWDCFSTTSSTACRNGRYNPYLLAALLFAALVAPIKHPLYDLVFVVVLTPLFVVLGAHSRSFAGAKWLGEISYPVYALHYSLLSIGSLAAGKAGAALDRHGRAGRAFCLVTPVITASTTSRSASV